MSDLPTFGQLDAMVEGDPLKLRDSAAVLTRRLADAAETIIGTAENGRWVLIPDPALREFVGRHVAAACQNIALDAGLYDAADECRKLAGDGKLPVELC